MSRIMGLVLTALAVQTFFSVFGPAAGTRRLSLSGCAAPRHADVQEGHGDHDQRADEAEQRIGRIMQRSDAQRCRHVGAAAVPRHEGRGGRRRGADRA